MSIKITEEMKAILRGLYLNGKITHIAFVLGNVNGYSDDNRCVKITEAGELLKLACEFPDDEKVSIFELLAAKK